jgi:hypothetical protein
MLIARLVAAVAVASASASASASAAAPAAVVGASSVCFGAPYDPTTCLTWRTDATNITFTAVWPSYPGLPSGVGWGGWGIASLTCGSMYPSSVWMAFRGPSGVALEDRAAVGHVLPQCRKQQLSYVTERRVSNDSFTISWTRPLVAPPSSGQPSIVPGKVTIIGGVFYGSLDLRPCESSGIPAHQGIVSATVELIPSAGRGPSAGSGAGSDAVAVLQAPPASADKPAAGLVGTFLVCSNAYTNLAHVTPAGAATYYGASSSLALLPGVSTVDVVGRRLYSLLESADGTRFDLVSINVDSGVRGATCATPFPVPPNYALQNLNIAWDKNNGTVLVAGCTDPECAGYVQLSRIDPVSCTATDVVKVAADPPLESSTQAASAFDPATNTFVMTISQAGKAGVVGPVLVTVNVLTGKVTHVLSETQAGVKIYALSSAGPPGLFLGLNVGADLRVALATFDAVGNKVSLAPFLTGFVEALPGISVLVPRDTGDLFFFLTEDGATGSARIVGVFAANGTLASAGNLPGDVSQAPSSLFLL